LKKTILILLFLGLIYVPISCTDDCETSLNNISVLSIEFGALQPFFNNYFLRDSTTSDSAAFRIRIDEIENVGIASVFPGFYPSLYAEDEPTCPTRLNHELQYIEITSPAEIMEVGPLFSDLGRILFLQMSERPDERIDGPFTVTFTFDDRILSITTEEIKIIPG